jgi:phosphocarrier protein FPr
MPLGGHVGLVVVSHSHALAGAAVALAREMVPADSPARIVTAAGLDETTFGTDATRIQAAITEADAGAGVVVLMDLGSAVLSAELALELLDDDAARARVVLCPAPLVEGLVVAAVAAAAGAPPSQVAADATDALTAKRTQLTPAPAAPAPAAPAGESGDSAGRVGRFGGPSRGIRPGESGDSAGRVGRFGPASRRIRRPVTIPPAGRRVSSPWSTRTDCTPGRQLG